MLRSKMQKFLDSLKADSEIYSIVVSEGTLELRPKPGHEEAFSLFTSDILNRMDDCAAFPRTDSHGRYDSVEIIC